MKERMKNHICFKGGSSEEIDNFWEAVGHTEHMYMREKDLRERLEEENRSLCKLITKERNRNENLEADNRSLLNLNKNEKDLRETVAFEQETIKEMTNKVEEMDRKIEMRGNLENIPMK